MLAPQRMGSQGGHGGHGGQNNYPFGYNPNVINNVAVPDFMTPGPPHGQPLLNDDENTNLNNFLSGFDSNSMMDKHGQQQQYQMNHHQGDMWNMPPTFVRSETTMGSLAGIDPAQLERHALMYGDGLGTRVPGVHVHPESHVPYGPGNQGLQDNWSQSLFYQMNSNNPGVQPGYSTGWQHQQLHPQGMPLQTPGRGPTMRFGSDSHFQPSGFTGPQMEVAEPELPLDWLESGPNTQPNTQPSSPNWSKKRKLENNHVNNRNGFVSNGRNPHRRQNSTNMKTESRDQRSFLPPVTPKLAKPSMDSLNQYEDPDFDEDAEAEDDDDPTATNTAALPSRESSPPAPWPSSRARPPKSDKPFSPKSSRKRKKSESSATPSSMKKSATKVARQPSSRVPLSQAQKKANHTNSEQRRRDATARGYAELYDLVPEVSSMGKQSTMKKLEVVVDKVQKTIGTVKDLRAKLGLQPGGSIADMAAAQGLDPEALGMLTNHDDERDEDEDDYDDEDGDDGANGTWD